MPAGSSRALNVLVVVAAVATIPLTIALERAADNPFVVLADWVVWGIFLLDYALSTGAAKPGASNARRDPLGLAIVILSFPLLPSALGLVRVARIARILRLIRLPIIFLRGTVALRDALGQPGLLYVAGINTILVLAGGVLLALVEPTTVRESVWNGVWWAVVTATTVGYGDITPVTPSGRIIGIILMLGGIGFVSTLAASIAAHFIGQKTTEPPKPIEAIDELRAEVGRLNGQLTRIERLLAKAEMSDAERTHPYPDA
jgi:voltage-gated potassium channel